MTDSVHALPTSVFSLILSFALDDFDAELIPDEQPLPVEQLLELATVSHAWRAQLEHIVTSFRDTRLQLSFTTGSNIGEEHLAGIDRLRTKHSTLRSLALALGTEEERSEWNREDRAPLDNLQVDWVALFANCNPKLQRLDLSGFPLVSRHLADVLEAAAVYCKSIQALVLPEKTSYGSLGDEVNPVFSRLYDALAVWHTSSGRGLRQLVVPHRNVDDGEARYSSEYLLAVAQYCPAIEYLEGWEQTYVENEIVDCEELFYVSKQTWHTFCEACRSLRHVHWVTLPFDEDFFTIFGDFVKPKLSHLVITQGYSWDEQLFMDSTGDSFAEVTSSQSLCHAIKACPNLQELEIVLHEYIEFDQNVFDDQFLLAVADSCPDLVEFRIKQEPCELELPIDTIVDSGVAALGHLRSLTTIFLRNVLCSGRGVYALLSNALKHPSRVPISDFSITVGGWSEESRDRFYETVEHFLTLVATHPIDQQGTDRFLLRLWNANQSMVDVQLRKQCTARFDELKSQVEKSNPSYVVAVKTKQFGALHTRYIGEVWLYTKWTSVSSAV